MSEAEDEARSERGRSAANGRKRPSKDNWDKAAAISGVVSSVLIAGFGLYFNHTAAESQQKLDALLGAQQHQIAVTDTNAR